MIIKSGMLQKRANELSFIKDQIKNAEFQSIEAFLTMSEGDTVKLPVMGFPYYFNSDEGIPLMNELLETLKSLGFQAEIDEKESRYSICVTLTLTKEDIEPGPFINDMCSQLKAAVCKANFKHCVKAIDQELRKSADVLAKKQLGNTGTFMAGGSIDFGISKYHLGSLQLHFLEEYLKFCGYNTATREGYMKIAINE